MQTDAEAMMTANELKAWRKRCGYSRAAACRDLGCSPTSFRRYERGERPVPQMMALACVALDVQLPDYVSTKA